MRHRAWFEDAITEHPQPSPVYVCDLQALFEIHRKSTPILKAPRLVEQIAVLRDTKHFVKDYQGNDLAPGKHTVPCLWHCPVYS